MSYQDLRLHTARRLVLAHSDQAAFIVSSLRLLLCAAQERESHHSSSSHSPSSQLHRAYSQLLAAALQGRGRIGSSLPSIQFSLENVGVTLPAQLQRNAVAEVHSIVAAGRPCASRSSGPQWGHLTHSPSLEVAQQQSHDTTCYHSSSRLSARRRALCRLCPVQLAV